MSWPGVTRSCHSGEVNRDSKVSRNPKIVARELGAPQGAVLLHLETGAYHGLNPVGFVVWELIDDRRTVADLVDGRQRQHSGTDGLADPHLVREIGQADGSEIELLQRPIGDPGIHYLQPAARFQLKKAKAVQQLAAVKASLPTLPMFDRF